MKLDDWKYYKKRFLIKIKGIVNRNEAKKINNYNIIVDGTKLPILKKGEYYWKDLIGCTVTVDGCKIGVVVNLIATGSNDVLVVRVTLKSFKIKHIKEVFIPFIENKVIQNIDLIYKNIEVNLDF